MGQKKILIIDDEPNMIEPVLDRLEFLFGTDSFKYTQYFSEALEALRGGNISCLYLDLIMPSDGSLQYKSSLINGINALQQIRESYPAIPIVCYTIVKEEETIRIINKYKATYISKTEDNSFYNLFQFFENNHQQ